ncbi:tyrosine kinase [Escherichia coli]|nr:tyrosine kinase [Escherichia coli]
MTEKVKQHAAPVTGSDEIDIGRLVGTVIEARWWGNWHHRRIRPLCRGLHLLRHADIQRRRHWYKSNKAAAIR